MTGRLTIKEREYASFCLKYPIHAPNGAATRLTLLSARTLDFADRVFMRPDLLSGAITLNGRARQCCC